MYIVTVTNYETTTFFSSLEEATKFAESKANNCEVYYDKHVSVTSYPRVVIHEIELNQEYTSDYLILDQYAIKIYNDF